MSTVFVCADAPPPEVPTSCSSWIAEPYEPSPWSLSVSDAQSIGASIAVLWATAWVIRTLARFLKEFAR